MATPINKRQVAVLPLSPGPDYTGNADAALVAFDGVPLTSQYLSSLGCPGLRQGQTWGVRLELYYRDADGALTAVDLSGASNMVMHIWHRTTAEFVDNRTEDATIGETALVELAIDGDGTAGDVTIRFHEDETLTTGLHHWAITADWTYGEVVAAGTIEISPGPVTS